jgi:hypothetical protein
MLRCMGKGGVVPVSQADLLATRILHTPWQTF